MILPHKLLALGALSLAVLSFAGACGGGGAGTTASPPASVPKTAGSGNDATEPGAADIDSAPRDVAGYGGAWQVDDGPAMFSQRPAGEDRTGVTPSSVKICHPFTQMGPAAASPEVNALLAGAVKRVNATGGIHGRTIDLVTRDDGGSPNQAAQVVKDLVENERCFLILGEQGSAIVPAVWQYLDERGVPNLMAGSGATQLGEPGKRTTLPGTLPDLLGGYALGESVWSQDPGEKLAVLYENDDYGKSVVDGFEAAATHAGVDIVALPFDPATTDLTAALNEAAGSGVTAVAGVAPSAVWPKLLAGLRQTLGAGVKIFDPTGAAAQAAKDLPDRDQLLNGLVALRWSRSISEDSPGVNGAKQVISEAGLTATQSSLEQAQIPLEFLTRLLACAGPDLTREAFLQAMNGGCLDGSWGCSVCLAPAVVTPQDRWPLESVQLDQYDGSAGRFKPLGDPVTYETALGNGIRGNLAGFQCSAQLQCPWKDGCTPSKDRCPWKPPAS